MDQPTRRRFLAAAGMAAVAGCTAGRRESPEPVEREPNTDPETEYAATYEATIGSVAFVGSEEGGGSGFVHDGHVVTNQHVVGDDDEIDVRFHDGEWGRATVQGADPFADLAVLSTNVPEYARPLSFVETIPAIGTEVLALGSPFGLESSVSRGIVSGRDRSLPSPTGFSIPNTVQTDAGLDPGNSGGPLVTLDGDVTGVAVAAAGTSVGFAVSPLLARRILPELVETGSYDHPFLGVGIREVTPRLAEANDLGTPRGVYIDEILAEGPSETSLEGSDDETTIDGDAVPVGGDVLVELADEPIETDADLGTVLALSLSPGDRADAIVIRDGEPTELTVPIGTRPTP